MGRLKVRTLRARDREAALRHLEREPRLNLPLLEVALRLGEGAARAELVGAFRAERSGEVLEGLAALQPSAILDARLSPEALEALFPHLVGVGSVLVKTTEEHAAPLWAWLAARGRRALLDRIEIGYALEGPLEPAPAGREAEVEAEAVARPATSADLDPLVEAARASLREEDRPDTFRGDPAGFRRWVRSRLSRATVVERKGEIVFVGYSDVQCPRGWLLQGVYTWPAWRRRGIARLGVAAICREAFAAGADHVQLAVVEGNAAAERLYQGLGFRRFGRLRTLLFV